VATEIGGNNGSVAAETEAAVAVAMVETMAAMAMAAKLRRL
jgi:hypothetical protein